MTKTDFDIQAVAECVRLIVGDSNVTELRVLNARTAAYRAPHTEFGYFDDAEQLAKAVETIPSAKGFYIIPNAVNPALLSRASNRIRPAGKGDPTTSDNDIQGRRWLLIDCDPVRPTGISSTEEEHEAARERARAICTALEADGWPEPIVADSGNGFHLMYRIDLPADDGGLIQRCLVALAEGFDDNSVTVDRTVFNPGRIWKLYGTLACKGDDTANRPHRMARIVAKPYTLDAVPNDKLEALAAKASADQDASHTPKSDRGRMKGANGHGNPFDLEEWIAKHNLEVTGPESWQDGRRWVFEVCPWNSDHNDGSAYIVQRANGAMGAGCHHNGCVDKKWHDLRDVVEPGWGDRVGADDAEDRAPKESQADRLVKLTEAAELFHTPGGHDAEPFATVVVSGHRETMPVHSKAFRRWLSRLFYEVHHKAPSSQGLQDALNVIAATALFDGSEHEVHVRLAAHNDAIWLDLTDAEWRAVEVTGTGWRVVASEDVPVRFARKRGMLSLPAPVPGGSIDELRPFVNLPEEDAWMLFVAWLVMSLCPEGPYPILVLSGEQGSAKSTAARIARALIDPNIASLRRPPKEDRELLIAATNGWIVAFDNLSGVSPALSDALCMLATGGGFGTRELYSDDAEKLFDAMRPIVVKGIDDLASRSDFFDRAITVTLPVIPPDKRRAEKKLCPAFELVRPRILGALLDAASAAICNLPHVELTSLPRMADFACWVTAAETALAWEPGAFLTAYAGNRQNANKLAIESSAVGQAIIGLVHARNDWLGTASELLAELEARHSDEKTRKQRDWPKTPRGMGAALRRIAPNLRAEGINIRFYPPAGRNKRAAIAIERTAEQSGGRAHLGQTRR